MTPKERHLKDMPVFLAHQFTIDQALTLLLFSAGIALVVADTRARDRNEKQARLQHAAYELGRQVQAALDGTHATAA